MGDKRPYYNDDPSTQYRTKRKKSFLERFASLFGGAKPVKTDEWSSGSRARYAQGTRGGEIIDQK